MVEKTRITELARKEWYVQAFNASPIHLMSAAKSAFATKEKLGFIFSAFLFEYKNNYGGMRYLLSDLGRISKILLKNLSQDEHYFEKLKIIYDKEQETAKRFYKIIDKTDLKNIKDKELFDFISKGTEAISNTVGIGHVIEPFALTTDIKIKKELSSYIKDEKQLNKIFIKLTTPTKKSFVNEEEESLIKISKSSNKDQLIEEHIKKFSWIRNTYVGRRPITKEDILKEIESIKDKPGFDFEKSAYEKELLLKEFDIPKELLVKIKETEFLTVWQDERKKNILIAIDYLDRLLVELSDRVNTDIQLIRYAIPEEFTPEIRNLKTILEERKRGSFYAVSLGKTEIIAGKDYLELKNKLEEQQSSKLKEFGGQAASLGTAIGRVKICTNITSLQKVEKGDILVASMTRPEYVPAMKKAAAIVTDEGGITSHAAIISRELGIPCVIGTKVATKVLRDNDIVEVKGNHGVIVILKRNK